jgi:hypothetical protein
MIGQLAKQYGYRLPIQVMQSAAGFYIGTAGSDGAPYSRESCEYFPTKEAADGALATGNWTQRDTP